MPLPWVVFWAVVVFGSIVWYAFLLFAIGYKAGREIVLLTRKLAAASAPGPRER